MIDSVRKANGDEFRSFYLVWTKPTDKSNSSSPIRTYAKQSRAEEVCLQMAEKHPGTKFFVMKAVYRAKVSKPDA